MSQGNIDFDAIKSESGKLMGSADEVNAALGKLQTLMDGLCEKNDAPALKRASDSLIETSKGFLKAVQSEMESVTTMVRDSEKLAAASGY